jgi:hypothetical protein
MMALDIYLGGERDREPKTIPKHFEYFFNARLLLIVLATVAALALLAGIP